MPDYTRFAIYYLPPEGALATFGAQWLGWDIERGQTHLQFDVEGLDEIVATPKKYGFHGTLKPPFRLATGTTRAELEQAIAALAATLAPVEFEALSVAKLGRFLALIPEGDTTALADLAAQLVTKLDRFRAPPSQPELERRRAVALTPQQEANLVTWGYPYVMDAFRFHLTLSGKLSRAQLDIAEKALQHRLPPLPVPFKISQIALVAERDDGYFETLRRFELST